MSSISNNASMAWKVICQIQDMRRPNPTLINFKEYAIYNKKYIKNVNLKFTQNSYAQAINFPLLSLPEPAKKTQLAYAKTYLKCKVNNSNKSGFETKRELTLFNNAEFKIISKRFIFSCLKCSKEKFDLEEVKQKFEKYFCKYIIDIKKVEMDEIMPLLIACLLVGQEDSNIELQKFKDIPNYELYNPKSDSFIGYFKFAFFFVEEYIEKRGTYANAVNVDTKI